MKKIEQIFLAAAFCLLPVMVYAQAPSRDMDVDAKLNAGALAGVAPPTGAQTAPAAAAGMQKFVDPYAQAALPQGKPVIGQTDGKARVYDIHGKALLIKKGSPVEQKLKKGDVIEKGDTVQTEAGAKVSITFDSAYTNAVQIPENSKAVFDGIEPTNIRVENGTIFNSVNGLPKGSSWKVTTPSAVAAVRGTLYLVQYQAANGQFFAATVNVPNDGKNSSIDIHEIKGNGAANVPEGKAITLTEGQSPDQSLVSDLDPAALAEILSFFENLTQLREENGAPATGGQGSPGEGLGENDPDLDVNDLGTLKNDSESQSENNSHSDQGPPPPDDNPPPPDDNNPPPDDDGCQGKHCDPQPDNGRDNDHGHR